MPTDGSHHTAGNWLIPLQRPLQQPCMGSLLVRVGGLDTRMKTIFDLCEPRDDVVRGRMPDEEFAADLAAVIDDRAPREYADPAVFFQNTYPTKGLKTLLDTVCRRLSGQGGEHNSLIRLDTQFGGGKTHNLIALLHAARGMSGVTSPDEFIDPGLLPREEVRIAALDGENSDPANGVRLDERIVARSLWGEMAYRLAGRQGFERVRKSDEEHIAPGVSTIEELFGGQPTLILLDEIAVYLRKVARVYPDQTDQFTAFIQALLKAVSATPNVALVFTLAVRTEDQVAKDAYRSEQQIAMQAFEEAESVIARKATQLNPTAEDETIDVLRRRLFDDVDLGAAHAVTEQYFDLWDRNKNIMPAEAFNAETREQFRRGYPMHPELLNTLIEKTSSLATFQRTRGMLRLLARTVEHLWTERPDDSFAIHPHHIDPAFEKIRGELTTKLGQSGYAAALTSDVAAVPGTSPAIAQHIDRTDFPGQPPVTGYLASTIFLHTLAYGENAQGITAEWLRYSVCSPSIEPAVIEEARKRFVQESLYLDDKPGSPLRFRTEPNLTQMIRKAATEVDYSDLRTQLNENISRLFGDRSHGFEFVAFPAGPYDIPDEIGDGKPYLAILGHDAFSVSDEPTSLPQEIVRMATRKGAREEYREFRNNVVFVVADHRRVEDMKQAVRHRLALGELQRPERIHDLADYQQRQLKERHEKSSFEVAQAIAHCYRHLFYPYHIALSDDAMMTHTAIEFSNLSDSPGNAQLHVKRTLRDLQKLLEGADQPPAPTFVRDQTALKVGGSSSTQELRNEFRKSPKLPILLDDDPFYRCIRQGIENGHFVLREGDQLWGPGDPAPAISISENVFVHTMKNAQEKHLWPRQPEPDVTAESGGQTATTADPPPSGNGATTSTTSTTPEADTSPAGTTLTAQAPLAQALREIFEEARSKTINRLGEVRIRIYNDQRSTWNLHQAVATYNHASARCEFNLEDLEVDGVERFSVLFRGRIDKANAVKSFLDSQMRTADEIAFNSMYGLHFDEGLSTTPDAAEQFIKAMTKYGAGEAFVEAEAQPESQTDQTL